jgi:hypothetical protein
VKLTKTKLQNNRRIIAKVEVFTTDQGVGKLTIEITLTRTVSEEATEVATTSTTATDTRIIEAMGIVEDTDRDIVEETKATWTHIIGMRKMIIISRITLGIIPEVKAIEVQTEGEPINKTKHTESIEAMSTTERSRSSKEVGTGVIIIGVKIKITLRIRHQIHFKGIISPEDIKMIIQMKINDCE